MQAQPEKPPVRRSLSTLQRGLRVLEAVAAEHGQITAKQLSKRTGMRQGSCYHVLRTLQEEGYVVRLPGGHYDLNGRVAFLQDSLRSRLTPDLKVLSIMRELHEQVDETTCVCGWYRERIVVQWYLEPRRALHARSLEIGYDQNAHARASTKAMLAFLPESYVRAYFAGCTLPKLTASTITDIERLLCSLATAARRGCAIDREEMAKGVCCIGAPYFDERAFPVGAYGLSAPLDRFEENCDQLTSAVIAAAHATSQKFGYVGTYPP
ncbi:MAG TPA: IclR family transcriptional regulator, partial [Chloroflexota bacterium]|nr:IclR family transcriptional regulator [Chloroflexota bacterium]